MGEEQRAKSQERQGDKVTRGQDDLVNGTPSPLHPATQSSHHPFTPSSRAKRVVVSEDAGGMPLAELAGRLEDAEVRGLAERLGRNEDMQKKWAQYIGYRRERGLPCTVRALKGHLETIALLHPNPSEAYHALHWTMTREWEFPQPMPKAQPRRPLPGMKAALAAAGIRPAEAGTPTEADLAALEEYKRLAVDMTPAERAALLRKCSDTLPTLSGSLAARITTLNARDANHRDAVATNGLAGPLTNLNHLARSTAKGMRAEPAQTNPRVWHNQLVEQKAAKDTKEQI